MDLEFLVLLVAFEYLELVLLHDCSEMLAPHLAGTGNGARRAFPHCKLPQSRPQLLFQPTRLRPPKGISG